MIFKTQEVKKYIHNPDAFLTIEISEELLEEFMNQVLDNHWQAGQKHSCGGSFVRRLSQVNVVEYVSERRPLILDSAICDSCGEIGMFCRGDDKCNHCTGKECIMKEI